MVNYYIIKMYPQIPIPQLELLNGGWMPVSQIVRGEAAVCVFTNRRKVSKFLDNYQQVVMGQFKSLEIVGMSAAEIGQLKTISHKLTMVAIDPILNFGQFSVREIKSIWDFGAVSGERSPRNLFSFF